MSVMVPFLQAVEDVTGGSPKLLRSEYAHAGRLPVVDQGKPLISGYTDDLSFRFKLDGKFVIFGDHTRAVKYVDFPFAMGADGVKVLRVRSEFDARYVYQYLRTVPLPAAGYSRHFKFLKEARVPKPALEEQRRVAAILDHADDLLAKRRRIGRSWEQLESAIFDDLFGNPLVNSKGWPVHVFGDLTSSMQYGPRFYNESYSPDGVPIVRITDLDHSGQLDFGSMPRMAVTDGDRDKFGLSAGDIVFARTGATVGKLALIKESDPDCIAGAYFIRIQLRDCLEPRFAAAFLRSWPIQSIIEAGSHQSAQQNFSGPGLRALPCPLPPMELQRQFSRILTEVEAQRAPRHEAVSAFDELFVSLQSRAFSGQL